MNLSIGDDGDLVIENGEVIMITGVDEIAQFVGQKLKTILGEWFLDVRLGLPYFDKILTKRVKPAIIEQIFIAEIVSTPGILNLLEFDLNLDTATRTMTVEFRALSTEGEVIFNEDLI